MNFKKKMGAKNRQKKPFKTENVFSLVIALARFLSQLE